MCANYNYRYACVEMRLYCRIGEGRACWSLGNAHTALGNHDQAMHFAEKHLEICKEVNQSRIVTLSFLFPLVFNLTKSHFWLTFKYVCFVLLDWRQERRAYGSYERV